MFMGCGSAAFCAAAFSLSLEDESMEEERLIIFPYFLQSFDSFCVFCLLDEDDYLILSDLIIVRFHGDSSKELIFRCFILVQLYQCIAM